MKEVTTMYAILIIGIIMLFFGLMDMIGKLIFGEDWDNDDECSGKPVQEMRKEVQGRESLREEKSVAPEGGAVASRAYLRRPAEGDAA